MARTTPELANCMRVGDIDASGAPIFHWIAPMRCALRGISLVNTDAVAAHATDIMTAIVLNRTQSDVEVARQTVDSDVTGYAAVVAKTEWPLILTTTVARLELEKGDVLELAVTEGGTATSGDMSDVSWNVRYQPGSGIGGV